MTDKLELTTSFEDGILTVRFHGSIDKIGINVRDEDTLNEVFHELLDAFGEEDGDEYD